MTEPMPPVDPRLVEAWLRARSQARGLPQPVASHGGLRVDTDSDEETARYLFVAPVEGIRKLGETIKAPRIFIKLCGSPDVLRSMLPAHWSVRPATVMMTGPDDQPPLPPLPQAFSYETSTAEGRTHVRIVANDGRLAASGYAVERDGVFAYDRPGCRPPLAFIAGYAGRDRRRPSALRDAGLENLFTLFDCVH